jgi:diaminopimelate decarboxylase
MERWEQMATAVIDFAATIERLSGRSLSLIDLGGGWTPDDFDTALEPALERLLAGARSRLAGEPTLLIEPGKALVEPALVVLARVVHVRAEQDGRRAAVLDAGIAEVPLVHSFPHRLALVRDAVETLDAGEEALVGPTCMEADVLAEGVRLPADLAPGDLVAIFDAGAYDASTAHVFGRGGRLQQW